MEHRIQELLALKVAETELLNARLQAEKEALVRQNQELTAQLDELTKPQERGE